MTTRYAYIVNGQTIWGPGANPYFLTLQNGDIWEVSAHTVEESETIGLHIIEQINKIDPDERFMAANTPEYSIVNGKPKETWSYSFIPIARENMLLGVDNYAEKARGVVATKYPGQYAEYDEVYREAVEVKALPAETVLNDDDYPFLKADINVTYSPILERLVENIREAADLVVETRNFWKEYGSNIRQDRLRIKKLIKDAETDEEAYNIYKAEIPE